MEDSRFKLGVFLREPAIIRLEKQGLSFEQILERLYERGFRHVQLPEGLERERGKYYTPGEIKAIEGFKGQIHFSFHHDEFLTNLCDPNNTVRENMIKSLERADKINAEYIVVHAGICRGGEYEACIDNVIENFRFLVDRAGGKTITVENVWDDRRRNGKIIGCEVNELDRIVREVDGIKLNLDFSHLILGSLMSGTKSPEDSIRNFIERFGEFIYSTHVNDINYPPRTIDGLNDVHFVPGSSEFPRIIIKHLRKIGYSGNYLLELGEGISAFDERYGLKILDIYTLAFNQLLEILEEG